MWEFLKDNADEDMTLNIKGLGITTTNIAKASVCTAPTLWNSYLPVEQCLANQKPMWARLPPWQQPPRIFDLSFAMQEII